MVVQAAAAAVRPPYSELAKLISSGSDYLACGMDKDTDIQENMSPDPKPTQVSGRVETASWVS